MLKVEKWPKLSEDEAKDVPCLLDWVFGMDKKLPLIQ